MIDDSRREALAVAAVYAAFGVLWIFGTDLLVERLAAGGTEMRRLQTLKGWAFVLASTGLLYAVVRRVLERHRRAERLSRRAERIGRLGHWELRLPDGELSWSEEVYRIFGVDPDEFEVTRQAFLELVHPEDRDRVEVGDETALSGEEALDVEHRIVRPDGEVRVVHERATLVEGEGHGERRLVGTVQDVTERKRLERQLERSRDLLRRYAAHLTTAREQERADLAREIHDHLGQLLTAAKLQLDRAMRRDGDASVEGLRDTRDLVGECIEAVREIAGQLRPAVVDQLGLVDGLAAYADQFEERAGIATTFSSDLDGVPLDGEASIHLFRVVQEALTNVARHAEADRARVELRRDGGGLVVSVRDDGKGLPEGPRGPPRRIESHGLLGMQERARLLGGDFELRDRDGAGAEVRVRVPWPDGHR